MDKFKKCLLVTVLKNILDEILVINKGRYKIVKVLNEKEPVNVRFKNKIHESVLKQLDPFEETIESLEDVKLQQDIFFLITTLSATIRDVCSKDSMMTLLDVIEKYNQERLDQENLLSDYETNKTILQDLERTAKTKISNSENRLLHYEETVANLKDELINMRKTNLIEKSLITKWEQTRIEQAIYLMESEKHKLKGEIELYRNKIREENEAILDIETFNRMQINHYNDLIEYWQKRYNDELTTLKSQITALLKEINEVEKKMEKHREIYSNRQAFIDDYLKQKAEEQKELELQQKRINSIIKIQAWWRGTMVRKQLGPYKKKKKGKKGKKK